MMATEEYEKVTESLQRLRAMHINDTCNGYRLSVALTEAIQAFEKRIPKKPDFEGDGYDNQGNLIYDTWICPCCEEKYEVEYEEYDFCPKCGQKISWKASE